MTTLTPEEADPRLIWRLGHERWGIENGLNELVNLWAMDHRYKHAPNAILAFVLTLFLVFVLTQTFYARNLQPEARRHRTRKALSEEFAAALEEPDLVRVWVPP